MQELLTALETPSKLERHAARAAADQAELRDVCREVSALLA